MHMCAYVCLGAILLNNSGFGLGPLAFTAMCLLSCHHRARLQIIVTLDQSHNNSNNVVNLSQKIELYLSILTKKNVEPL